MHRQCVAAGLDITLASANMPWNVREIQLRHSDDDVFRVGRGFELEK
jgi:hypothetical protein